MNILKNPIRNLSGVSLIGYKIVGERRWGMCKSLKQKAFFVGFIVIMAILIISCAGDTKDGGDFVLVSGSGIISVQILGANTGGHGGSDFYFGTISIGTAMGSELVIADDDETGSIDEAVITGGYVLEIGGFIDVNDNGDTYHMADDGDYVVTPKTITVSGNETVTLTYPDDFTVVSGSGTVSVNLLGASSGGHGGKSFHFGTMALGTPLGGDVLIDSDDVTDMIENGMIFPGGITFEVGGFIDVNGNAPGTYMADDGDYLTMNPDVVTVAGNTTATIQY